MDLKGLQKEFPKSAIHWRAQQIRNKRALALAYIDARDVMNRLDECIGPENWQDAYHQADGRTFCRISIRIGDEWVSKSDGAGDTQVEGEKGAISDAFKRAAVKWGIGRYLYAMPAPWVPCETYMRGDKEYFRKFTASPWEFLNLKDEPVTGKLSKVKLQNRMRDFDQELHLITDDAQFSALLVTYADALEQCERDLPSWYYGKEGSDTLGIKDRIDGVRQKLLQDQDASAEHLRSTMEAG